jgi:spectrin beta
MQIRRDNLEDALLLYQFQRDVEDELQWLAEKQPFAASSDYGSSLNTVQKLQKKQQVLEGELLSHEPVVNALSSRAQQMIRSGHFASQRIDALLSDAVEKFTRVKELAAIRKHKLQDALQSQMVSMRCTGRLLQELVCLERLCFSSLTKPSRRKLG